MSQHAVTPGRVLLDAEGIQRTLSRIAHEVIERNEDIAAVALSPLSGNVRDLEGLAEDLISAATDSGRAPRGACAYAGTLRSVPASCRTLTPSGWTRPPAGCPALA